jgi:SAM-dependent methyltransferase
LVVFLSRHFKGLNERYHGPEGDQFAIDELNPVAKRFLPAAGSILEVGCGYGRNLWAMARLDAKRIVGCDVSWVELYRAQGRLATLAPVHHERVHLVRQEPYALPFPDDSFDLVVLWQVLEHLFAVHEKQQVLSECVRVLRPGGHILVETPNQLFPFDYHDNKLPFVHWFFPKAAREWLTFKVRGKRYHPSMYMTVWGYENLLRKAPRVVKISKATRIYFARSFAEAWRELSGSQVPLKRLIFAAVAPVHALLSLFGQSADVVLPSIRIVWRVDKREAASIR